MWVCRGRCVCACMWLTKILLATKSRAPGKKEKDKATGTWASSGMENSPGLGTRSLSTVGCIRLPLCDCSTSSLSLGPLFLTHSFFFLLTMWFVHGFSTLWSQLYIKAFFFFFFLVLAPTSDGTVFPMFLSLNCRDRKYSAAGQPAVWLFWALEFTSGPIRCGQGAWGRHLWDKTWLSVSLPWAETISDMSWMLRKEGRERGKKEEERGRRKGSRNIRKTSHRKGSLCGP